MSLSLNNLLQRPIVGGRGTMTVGNLMVLAFILLCATQLQAASNAAHSATPSIGQSGFPTVAEGVVAWIKTIVGGGSAWGVYDKIGGGRDVGQTMKDAALPITGLGLVASPDIIGYFTGNGGASATAGKASIMSLLESWNFTFN